MCRSQCMHCVLVRTRRETKWEQPFMAVSELSSWLGPPIVTFALSLMAITVTIFLVAFYFKNKNVISDVQAEEDWASFKHHLNQQKFCVSESGTHPLPSVLTNEVKSIASQVNNAAFFYAVVNGWRTNQMWLSDSGSAIGVALTGVTNLEGWERSCHYQNDLLTLESTKLTITIIIPNLKLFNNSHLSCVYVKAPSYLHWPATRKSKSVGNSAESLRDQCEIAVADIKTSLPLLSGNKEQGDDSGCEKVDIFQLSYDFGEYESNIYLTKDARLLFFSHLLQIGYILLGILLILIVSSILIGRNVAATRRHTLLPTRETHS